MGSSVVSFKIYFGLVYVSTVSDCLLDTSIFSIDLS